MLDTLDTVRYWFAWLTVASLPAAVVYWYTLHPLVGFWRRVGKFATYTVLSLLFVANLAIAWWWRSPLMDAGDRPVLAFVVIGAVLYVAAGALERVVRRQLKFSVLAGSPELDPDGSGGHLLDQGIYARMRHPRYVSLTLGMLGVALLVNYRTVWILAVLLLPALFLVVLLEERELRGRFGERYAEYARRVPRFVPRRRGG